VQDRKKVRKKERKKERKKKHIYLQVSTMLSAICDELAVFCQFSEKASAKSAIGHEIERRELKT